MNNLNRLIANDFIILQGLLKYSFHLLIFLVTAQLTMGMTVSFSLLCAVLIGHLRVWLHFKLVTSLSASLSLHLFSAWSFCDFLSLLMPTVVHPFHGSMSITFLYPSNNIDLTISH